MLSRRALGAAVAVVALLVAATWALGPSAPPRSPRAGGPAGPGPIVFLGNSITSGHLLPPDEAFPHHLGQRLGTRVVNAGISGDTTDGGLARLERDVLAHDPGLVVVELGVNDIFRREGRDRTLANLRTITHRLREHGTPVVLLHISLPTLAGDGYRADLRELARTEGAILVEDFLQGVVPGHTYDGLHPDRDGHDRLAERLLPVLQTALGR